MLKEKRDTLSIQQLPKMIDPSALKIDTSERNIDQLIQLCETYEFEHCYAWPCYYDKLTERLQYLKTRLGASLAFPSGQNTTIWKVKEAEMFMKYKPAEIDMVMNIGLLKDKKYKEAIADIKAVKAVIGDVSLKVIIEAMLLSESEIRTACKIVIESGADYVKTGTGFSQGMPTTLEHVAVIVEEIQESGLSLKVAGGIRSLDTILQMYSMGADKFGIGYTHVEEIMSEAALRGPLLKI